MTVEHRRLPGRSLATVLAAMLAVLCLGWMSSISPGMRLLTSTMLLMGGNSNPQGVGMVQELSGYLSAQPGTPYAGYEQKIVTWSAQIPFSTGSDGTLFDASQAEGVAKIQSAVANTYQPGAKLVVVGYSSSASVVTRLIRGIQSNRDQGVDTPSPADLSFVMFGNPNRPNGGIMSRFPGLYIPPPLGVTFQPSTPGTAYQITDISWEYDPVSDFPNYPVNLLADLNAALGFGYLHGSYYPADPTNASTIVSDTTVGNTRYLTLAPPHLPLLMPLYQIGVAAPLLDAVEPALKVLVDLGYNRTISPATPTPAQLIPPPVDLGEVAAKLAAAVGEGLRRAVGDLVPAKPPAPVPATTTATTATTKPATTATTATTAKPATTTATAKPATTAATALPAESTAGPRAPDKANTSADAETTSPRKATGEPVTATPTVVKPTTTAPTAAKPPKPTPTVVKPVTTKPVVVKPAATTPGSVKPADKPASTTDKTPESHPGPASEPAGAGRNGVHSSASGRSTSAPAA